MLCILLLPAVFATAQPDIANTEYPRIRNIDTAGIRKALNRAFLMEVRDPDSAIILNKEILDRSRMIGYNFGIAGAYYQLGKAYTYKGLYDSANLSLQHAFYYLNDEHTINLLLPALYSAIAYTAELKGSFDFAADLYIKSALFAEKTGRDVERYYSNLALVLMRLKRYNQALNYLNQAERLINKKTAPEVWGAILVNKGLMYAQLGDTNKSLTYLDQGLQYARKNNLAMVKHTALINIGTFRLHKGAARDALKYFQQTWQLKDSVPPFYQNASLRKMGETYIALGMYDSADYFLYKADTMAQQTAIFVAILEANLLLARRYEKSGDYRKAYQYYKQYVSIQDSLTDIESGASLNRLEVKYRTSQKEKENAEYKLIINLQKERLLRSYLLLGGISVLLIVISMAFFFIYHYRQKLQKEKIYRMQQNEEIHVLQAMMHGEEKERARLARELHDGIGGMLASVKMNLGSLRKQHPQIAFSDAIRMLDQTAQEIRETSHNMMPELLYRYGLSQAIKLFCGNLAKTTGLAIEFQCVGMLEKLNKNFELSIYRMIQELVQNVVKHAAATRILVQLSQHDKLLEILVEDNGIGMEHTLISGGMGLDSLQSRVKLMNGNFSLESAPGVGTSVSIEFNLNKTKAYFNETNFSNDHG